MSTVRLQVILSFQSLEPSLTPARVFLSTLAYPSDTPLRTIVAQVLQQHSLLTSPEEWTISFEGRALALNHTLAQAIPGVEQRASVTLFLCPVPFSPVGGQPRPPAEPAGPSDYDEDAEYELSLDMSVAEAPAAASPPPPAPASALPPAAPGAARPAPAPASVETVKRKEAPPAAMRSRSRRVIEFKKG